jgi:hypothetical protein
MDAHVCLTRFWISFRVKAGLSRSSAHRKRRDSTIAVFSCLWVYGSHPTEVVEPWARLIPAVEPSYGDLFSCHLPSEPDIENWRVGLIYLKRVA